jgi:hypothetical protein
MVTPHKSNDNHNQVILPLAPNNDERGGDISDMKISEMEIYARFMRHLRLVPNSRIEIKVLSSIQFTADMLDVADAFIAKTLVDQGLRAARQAFPQSYLEFVDKNLLRKQYNLGTSNENLNDLRHYWNKIGEDKFAAFKYDLRITHETTFVET